ncbi:MAG: lipoyl synthase [Actinomycetota bacterium]
MAQRDHNPHKRRLYLPLAPVDGMATDALQIPPRSALHGSGCAQPARPSGPRPEWLKVRARLGPNYADLKHLMRGLDLHTVCEEASCPNIYECWEDREATFLVLGDLCTRRCGFCDVQTAKPLAVDPDEPARIADAVREMQLRYVVLTGVARDDLPDNGAEVWAACIRAVRDALPGCRVEVLPTDFRGIREHIRTVIDAEPDAFAHNLETIRRLHPRIRPAFDYERTLGTLRIAKEVRPRQITKSNLILGMGEEPDEVAEAMQDLRGAGCDILTIGQYLQPTMMHLPVDRWAEPAEFDRLAAYGREIGFAHVEAGPLVRSSYRAGRQFASAQAAITGTVPVAP